jgi:hypothetical protein
MDRTREDQSRDGRRARTRRRSKAPLVAAATAALLALSTTSARCEQWVQVGPEGGALAQLAYAPSDARTVYAATSVWGASRIFRSTDGGSNWSAASEGLPSLIALSMAIDPASPELVYVGTNQGVWRTTNAGAHWTPCLGPLEGQDVYALAVDLRNPGRVFAGVQGSGSTPIYRSDDGGASWTAASRGLPDTNVEAIATDPRVDWLPGRPRVTQALHRLSPRPSLCEPRFWRDLEHPGSR